LDYNSDWSSNVAVKFELPESLHNVNISGGFWPKDDSLTIEGSGGIIASTTTKGAPLAGENPNAPVITDPGYQLSEKWQTVSLQGSATYADSDPMTYSATGLPDSLSMSTSGLVTGIIAAAEVGIVSDVQVTVEDQPEIPDSSKSDVLNFNWEVYDGSSISWADSTFGFRTPAGMDPDLIPNSDTLLNFPLVIDASQSEFSHLVANAKSTGGDIFVTAWDGTTVLSRDLEEEGWSTTNRIWFEADSLSDDHNKWFVYYGKTAAALALQDTTTWSAYKTVYHFEKSPGGGVLTDYGSLQADADTLAVPDSARTYGLDAGWSSDDTTSGPVGQAWYFDGRTHSVRAGHSSDPSPLSIADSSFTISAWVLVDRYYLNSDDSTWIQNPSDWGGNDPSAKFIVQVSGTAGWHLSAQINQDTTGASKHRADYAGGLGLPDATGYRYAPLFNRTDGPPNVSDSTSFHHFAWTLDAPNDTVIFYWDGTARIDTSTIGGTIPTNENWADSLFNANFARCEGCGGGDPHKSHVFIGDATERLNDSGTDQLGIGGPAFFNGADHHGGGLDEFRVAEGVKTANWILAEYNSIVSPDLAIGAAERDSIEIQAGASGGAWLSTNWSFRKKLSSEASLVPSNQFDVPVVVDLSDMGAFLFQNSKSDGSDIVVTGSNGDNVLHSELVFYDSTNSAGELWFRADTLLGALAQDFYVYYDNADTTISPSDSTFQDAVAAYHFQDSPTDTLRDSSPNASWALPKSFAAGDTVEGAFGATGGGRAWSLDGSVDWIEMDNLTNGGDSTYTFSMWAWWDSTINNTNLYSLDSNKLRPSVAGTPPRWRDLATGDWYDEVGDNDSTWVHIAVAYTDASHSMYLNGAAMSLFTGDGLIDSINVTGQNALGAESNGAFSRFPGYMDEVIIMVGTMTDDWITTTYNNQDDPVAFWSVGSQEVPPEAGDSTIAPTFLLDFGTKGSGDGQLNSPIGVLTNAGVVYVSDTNNNRIQSFTPTGTYSAQWGSRGTGTSQFRSVGYMAVDSNGDLYVTDVVNHRVQKFSSSGNFVRTWGSRGNTNGKFRFPRGVVFDSNTIYVVDSGNQRVQSFDTTGAYLGQFGSSGTGNGQFRRPAGIGVDSGSNLYVSDMRRHNVQKFTSAGSFLLQWGGYGVANGQLATPRGVTVDDDDYIYVSDEGNHRVQKFNASGLYLTEWGSQGPLAEEFLYPVGIYTVGDTIYVSDNNNHRIQKFVNQ
jgi:hypothetical protein